LRKLQISNNKLQINSKIQIKKNIMKIDEAILNKIGTISDLVVTQKSGISSRTIVDAKHTNITLFAFDSGQKISEHITPYNALVQVPEGEIEITIGGEINIVKTGQIIVMPKDIPHSLIANKKSIMILTLMKEA